MEVVCLALPLEDLQALADALTQDDLSSEQIATLLQVLPAQHAGTIAYALYQLCVVHGHDLLRPCSQGHCCSLSTCSVAPAVVPAEAWT